MIVERYGTNSGLALNHRPRNASRRRRGRKAAAEAFARRRLQRFPFLSALDRDDLRAQAFCSHVRENAALQIERSLSFFIERMHGHDAALAALANEDGRHWMIDNAGRINTAREPPYRTESIPRVSVQNRRGIKPAAAGGIEEPPSIVVGSPAPRLIADPGPAKSGIHDPLSIREGGPAEARSEWPPPISISPAVGKGAISIEIGESRRVVRRTRVLQRCARGR